MYIVKLNHQQRKDRRRQMAEAVKSGKTTIDVAIEFGACVATVCAACRENGMVGKRGPRMGVAHHTKSRVVSREEWESADWTLRDTDLAKQLGVSRERVRQVRNALGKPRSDHHRQPASAVDLIRWLRENRESVAGLFAQDIVDLSPFPTKPLHVTRACAKLGIELRQRASAKNSVTKENIEGLVAKRPGSLDTPCWEWLGKAWPNGYGRIGIAYAHRFSYELFHGPIRDGLWCLHKCDNPVCVNPDHLYAGTPTDNAQDREMRGRGVGRHLTDQEVADIRRERTLSGTSLRKLAGRYGVCSATIYRVIRGADAYGEGIQAKAS